MTALARLIAWRYLFSSRQRFVPFLSMLACASIVIGVGSFIVVLSVMRGFQRELNHRLVGLNAHITISSLSFADKETQKKIEIISGWPQIEEIFKYVEGEIIIQSPGFEESLSFAGKVKGLEKIPKSFLSAAQIYPQRVDEFSLMVGEELASLLGVHPDFKDDIQLIYPFGEIGPSGDFVPKSKKFRVSHIFKTGFYEWDAYRVLIPFAEAQSLLGEQGQSGLHIKISNLGKIDEVKVKLQEILKDPVKISTFSESNKRLFSALKLERSAMAFVLILFALISSFSVVGLLLLFIDAKRRDFAILRALGLPLQGAREIFLAIGATLGAIGALVGGTLGILVCFILKLHPVRLPSTYYLDYLPVDIEPASIFCILLCGFFLAIFSSWYPVKVASQLELLPMLREE